MIEEEDHPIPQPSRRTTLKRFVVGLAVGVPALSAIANPGIAHADPPHRHCVSSRWKLTGVTCICNRWISHYVEICTVCLDECGTTKDEIGGAC
ncbi:hypothetical protein ACFRCG_33185 [Embleya sp. NPDC056575]|uniref:hypothetical protein n=1 Tax=unclassified Embleya TaxID=2699296 RepID=UPI0036B289A4